MDSRKKIEVLRAKIDNIDHKILDLYEQRLHTVVEIANLKIEAGMEAEQPERLLTIRQERSDYVRNTPICESTLERLVTLFHDDAVVIQQEIILSTNK